MREDILDMMLFQQYGERMNPPGVAKLRNLIGLAVGDEPFVCAEPAVTQPDSIFAKIMATVGDIEARLPRGVSAEENCEHNDAACDGAPRRPQNDFPTRHVNARAQ